MLMINVCGALLIALIIYWFWLYTPKQMNSKSNAVTILVKNGIYQPNHINMAANSAVSLNFDRQDKSPCAETVQFPELGINKSLSIGDNNVELGVLDVGEYAFHCQMNMYKGKLTIS